jgi:TPR repeat protein
MTSLRKIAAPVTCLAVVCGAAILWLVYKDKATDRKLAEAARVMRVRAEHGEADAQYSLGNSYRQGEGVPRDYAESVRWLRKAADQGDAKAQSDLAFMYSNGKGVTRDYAEALRLYRKAAEQGYAKAQYGLCYMYGRGQGVTQDYAEAVRWCRQAAELGDATAQYAMGLWYVDGKGVTQDYAEAAAWYRKAAEQGDAKAQYVLGLMYYRGQGVPRDYTEAFRWVHKAADQGDGPAQAFLTVSYFKGQGVPKNYAEAFRWFRGVVVSCFARIERGPLARGTFILGLLLALPILVVPQRRWGRATWLPLALLSAALAAAITHELSILALLPRGLLATLYGSHWRVAVLAVLAGLAVLYAIGAVVEARRGWKRGGDQGQPPAPPESTLESPT